MPGILLCRGCGKAFRWKKEAIEHERQCLLRRIVDLNQEGYSMLHVADVLKIAPTTAHYFLRQAGIQPIRWPNGKSGPQVDKISFYAKAIGMRRNGHTFRDIAQKLGLTRQRIHQIWNSYSEVLSDYEVPEGR